jgi:hypothetical protein
MPKSATWSSQGSRFAERCTPRRWGSRASSFVAQADGVSVRMLGDFSSSMRRERARRLGYADFESSKSLLRRAILHQVGITTRSA